MKSWKEAPCSSIKWVTNPDKNNNGHKTMLFPNLLQVLLHSPLNLLSSNDKSAFCLSYLRQRLMSSSLVQLALKTRVGLSPSPLYFSRTKNKQWLRVTNKNSLWLFELNVSYHFERNYSLVVFTKHRGIPPYGRVTSQSILARTKAQAVIL